MLTLDITAVFEAKFDVNAKHVSLAKANVQAAVTNDRIDRDIFVL